jgi:hypothetical protein
MTAEQFIQQYKQLMLKAPRIALVNMKATNSEYCTWSISNKNCYMCFAADHNEDCMWCRWLYFSKDCTDCNNMHKSTLCYECLDSNGCYNSNHLQDCENCTDCDYCYDCIGCNNCIGCAGQRHAQYKIFNKQYSKDDYFHMLTKITQAQKINPAQAHEQLADLTEQTKQQTPRKYVHMINAENCTGDYIYNSKNCHDSFDINDSEDCGYICEAVDKIKDCYDIFALEQAEMCYEGVSNWGFNINFSIGVWFSSNLEYCDTCQNCKDCFGCISLRAKQYCILNRQYSPEEYARTKATIIEDMREKDLYGKWFPESPYQFEDTLAAD